MAVKKTNQIDTETGTTFTNLTGTTRAAEIAERFDDSKADNILPGDDAMSYLSKKIDEVATEVDFINESRSDRGSVEFAKKLATVRKIGGVSFNGSANIDLPGVNTTGNQNTSGNAGTANTLRSARTIGGVSFDGSANINLPGVNTTGNQDTSGTAAEATILETARTIGGVSFDGSANINLPGVNTSGSQDTTGNAATATNAKGYKGSNTTYMLMPKDFYMVSSTSNYSGGYITIPAGGECHAQLSLPVGSSITKKTLTINSSQTIASVVTVYGVPFDGVGSPTLTMVTGGSLGKQMTISGKNFDASKYYLWIKISLNDDNSATRVYGGTLTFTNS